MRLVSKSDKNSRLKKFRLPLYCLAFLFLGLFLGWKNVPGFLKANFVLLTDSKALPSLMEDNDLETLHLNVSFKNLQKIEAKRDEALANQKLLSSDDDFVKAVISSGNERLDCKIRLKGDLSDHWSGDKWSLRVEMKGDGLIKGMSRFSLQDPVTRNNTAEWLFLNNLRKENGMAVRYQFVSLVLNGKPKGIYAMEEHFSKEMIEANHRREGVIVNYDDELLWKKFPVDMLSNVEWNSIFRSSLPDVRNNKEINKNTALKRQKFNAFNLLRSIQESNCSASSIFQVEKTGKFLAITHLWSAERGLLFSDINFYFDPIVCKLEPIGFDGNPKSNREAPYCYFTWGDLKNNWVNFALKDQRIAESYVKHLERFSSENYILEIQESFSDYEYKIRKLLFREMFFSSPERIWKNDGDLLSYDPWKIIKERSARMRNELNNEQPIVAFGRPDKELHSYEIVVKNTTKQPVEIAGFKWGTNYWKPMNCSTFPPINQLWIKNDMTSLLLPHQGNGWGQTSGDHRFKLTFENNSSSDSIKENDLFILTRFLGKQSKYLRVKVPIDDFPFDPQKLPFGEINRTAPLPSFALERNGSVFIPKGIHQVKTRLFIPDGKQLFILPGAKLLFEKNATIISENQIHAIGTSEEPIIFSSIGDTWGGMLLVNSPMLSRFEHVEFGKIGGIGKGPNLNGITNNGWTMTGGITIYNSPTHFSSCTFDGMMTEDALNIISSSFSLNSCTFRNLYSDAFDGDFVNGEVRNCTFSAIKGDGVDFSGSQVSVINCSFADVKDKAISIGEGSQVHVKNARIDRVTFGIVSKDLSQATVSGCKVSGADIAGFSAFQKKNSFGPAKMTVSKSEVVGSAKAFLVQDGSSVRHNGTEVETVPLDVEKLYTKK
jgi:hypothetical protein